MDAPYRFSGIFELETTRIFLIFSINVQQSESFLISVIFYHSDFFPFHTISILRRIFYSVTRHISSSKSFFYLEEKGEFTFNRFSSSVIYGRGVYIFLIPKFIPYSSKIKIEKYKNVFSCCFLHIWPCCLFCSAESFCIFKTVPFFKGHDVTSQNDFSNLKLCSTLNSMVMNLHVSLFS